MMLAVRFPFRGITAESSLRRCANGRSHASEILGIGCFNNEAGKFINITKQLWMRQNNRQYHETIVNIVKQSHICFPTLKKQASKLKQFSSVFTAGIGNLFTITGRKNN